MSYKIFIASKLSPLSLYKLHFHLQAMRAYFSPCRSQCVYPVLKPAFRRCKWATALDCNSTLKHLLQGRKILSLTLEALKAKFKKSINPFSYFFFTRKSHPSFIHFFKVKGKAINYNLQGMIDNIKKCLISCD